MLKHPPRSRRAFLHLATKITVAGGVLPFARPALASFAGERMLAFDHLHTGERIARVFAIDTRYVPDTLNAFNLLLRDHYSGEVGVMDPALFDLLHAVKRELDCNVPFQVISGYRSATTNAALRSARDGGVARRSLHMEGRAIDIRLAGVPLVELRDAALSLRRGGVGFYPEEQFVHVDTGRVRSW